LEAIGRGMGVMAADVDPPYGTRGESVIDRLEQALQMNATEETPAPPFVDDPTDPPPGIDMEFRTSPPPFPSPHTDGDHVTHLPPVDPPPSIEDAELQPSIVAQPIRSPSFRPPPYLNTTAQPDGQHGPPPYVDLR
jgi:neural Wiskott-Aldrich syndrome protein